MSWQRAILLGLGSLSACGCFVWPAINNKPAPLAMIRLQVRSGLGAMPAFPEKLIADQEIDQLLTFVDEQREQSR